MDNTFRSQFSDCAGCYMFDNQIQYIFTPHLAESSISYSNAQNDDFYQIVARIRDTKRDVSYFDIIEQTSQYDLFTEFQNELNIVVLNQFAMFITKPHQYSIKRPKYFINYYNLLEATVCQAQQFNIELTTLLFQCGFTMMYYQIDGGKYCVMNKILNFTLAQQCTVGDTTIQLDQIPGSGVYTVTFLSPNYQKYLNSQQYSNCFMFLDEFNRYLTQLYQNLNLKFVYFNDNIYSEDLINITAPYGQVYTLQPVYEQRKTKYSLNILVVVSVVFAIIIYSSTVNM
ncbi:Hypothetical_protein [Hexamita inflata]|uniref:Hypothetical_protein n=1 Tax=Hexamita inflata TaxID=28002 RepID=A0AA86S0A0_9EUKA|nr:Hypothetical protein HINF_LOCUS63445 [Hexamita inflata]